MKRESNKFRGRYVGINGGFVSAKWMFCMMQKIRVGVCINFSQFLNSSSVMHQFLDGIKDGIFHFGS